MFKEVSELCLAQGDGGLPTAVAFGSAPGESGILVFRAQFQGRMHVSATPRRHHVCFQLTPLSRFDCHIADQALSHSPAAGSLSICPAGADYSADAEENVDAILVAIDASQFALAAAEDSALEAELIERLRGDDRALLDVHLSSTEHNSEPRQRGLGETIHPIQSNPSKLWPQCGTPHRGNAELRSR